MKIAFLHLNQGLIDRGMERVVDLYASELSKKHKVLIIQSGPLVKDKKYHAKRVYPLSEPPQVAPNSVIDKIRFRLQIDPNSVAVRGFTASATSVLAKYKPAIIIACNGAPQIKLLKSSGVKSKIVVFGAAGLGHHDINTLRSNPDLYIALTQSGKRWATQYAPSSTQLAVIPNPVVLSTKKSKINLNLPKPIVLTVAALSRYKHVVELTKALLNLPVSHLIIGDGEEGDRLQKLLSQRVHDFRWIKHVEPDELRSYYDSVDVFCLTPDKREAFGNVYIEAMASGLPIVATDDPVRREIIGEQGFYVDSDNPSDIQAAVLSAVKIGRQNYTKNLKRYNVKTVTKKLERALYDLLK